MPSLQGTLTLTDPRGSALHHFPVVLRGTDPAGGAIELARGETDAAGAFALAFDAGSPTTLVGLESVRRYSDTGAPLDAFVDAFELPVAPGQTDLGDVAVPYWPYHPERPVARAGMNARGHTDQQHAPGYQAILEKSAGQVFPIGRALAARAAQGVQLSIADVQDAYPEVLTRRIDRFAEHAKSDAWLGEVALDGFNTAPWLRETHDSGHLAMAFEWGNVPSDGVHDLSDVVAFFEERNGKLFPSEIRVALRRPASATEWRPTLQRSLRPGDPEWEQAKHVFRCHYVLSGALDGHIIKTHLLVEQFAIAAYRNLRRSPLRHLLLPHLQEVVAADTDADNFAWGPDGQIPKGSALKFPVVEERMRTLLGQMDWRGWSPRKALSPEHKYATLLERTWELLGRYVDEFIATNREGIAQEWLELQRFSNELVARSPARVPQTAPAGFDWACTNEIAPAGEAADSRALSPVILSDMPNDADLARLAAMSRYLLCQATFVHTWVHDGQYDVGGDMTFASLALRNGSFGPLDEVGPTFEEAISALTTNSTGLSTNYGFVIANEESDVPPALRALFLDEANAYRAAGFDVRRIRSRINI